MKQAVQLGCLSAVNIGLVFLFQFYVLALLGAGVSTDALFAGMTIPQLVLAVISGSLVHVLVPLLASESEESLLRDAWAFMAIVGGGFSLLAATLYILAPFWVPLTVPGFDIAGQNLTVELTRIQLIGMAFTAINGVQWATYHARQQFFWAEFTQILASAAALILLVWALPRLGVIAAAWISTLRLGVQTLLLAPGMGKPIQPDLNSAVIQKAWRRITPLLFGTAYYKTDPLVDRSLLSSTSSGSLSLYYLAYQIYGAANQVVNKALTVPLVPVLSKLHKLGDKEDFWQTYKNKLIQVALISSICFLIFCVLGEVILSYLIGYGNISSKNITELWWIMFWLGGMFIGGALGQISSSSFYASGDTKTPTRIGVYTYTLYIPVKIVSFYIFNVAGLALTTSAFLMVNFICQNHQLKNNIFPKTQATKK